MSTTVNEEQSFLPPKFLGLALPQSLIRICEKAMQFNIEDPDKMRWIWHPIYVPGWMVQNVKKRR